LTNDEYETLYRAMRTYCAKHNKLDGVDEREQYEHLSQLLHIQKATRYKR
jgi:hypothetical protein